MKYWLIIDSVQRGPLSLDEVAATPGLQPTTPVWHEGLADWTTAIALPEIAAILDNRQPYNPGYTQAQQPFRQYAQQPYGQQRYPDNAYASYASNEPINPNGMPPMPNNYLVWAIIATICCCLPTGVVAIIYASKVSPAYIRGDYNAALDASSKAQWWVIISFVAGLIWLPFSVIFSMF